jgi:hypothetical protein
VDLVNARISSGRSIVALTIDYNLSALDGLFPTH